MKRSLVLPLLTATIGFGLGGLLRPVAAPVSPPSSLAATPVRPTPAKPSPAATAPSEVPAQTAPGPHLEPPTPVAGRSDATHGTRNAAKMLRLIEALGLSETQQADLVQLIADSQKAATPDPPAPAAGATTVLGQFAARGAALEQGLSSLLTPEQSAAFEALRKRERDNRSETTAQRELANLSEVTDLSAEQRAKVLGHLRQASADELAAMPPAFALVVDSSVLPVGGPTPSTQSIQTLLQLTAGQVPEDPAALQTKLIASQRRELDARLNLLKDILTPAQLAQYQATVAEQYSIQDAMRAPK